MAPAQLVAVIDAIFEWLGQHRADEESWYTGEVRPHGMVQMFQHEALWQNRQNPDVYRAFVDLLGNDHLWVSIDRANMKPPTRHDKPGWGDTGFLHWDVDPREQPQPRRLQGVLALEDTPANLGGFQCSPELYRCLDTWLADKPAEQDRVSSDGRSVRRGPPDLSAAPIHAIAMRAGDLLIWDSRLPHGNGPNHGSRPRLAQYITMKPAGEESERLRRVSDFQNRRLPDEFGFPTGCVIPEPGVPPALTPLGRRLLGIDRW